MPSPLKRINGVYLVWFCLVIFNYIKGSLQRFIFNPSKKNLFNFSVPSYFVGPLAPYYKWLLAFSFIALSSVPSLPDREMLVPFEEQKQLAFLLAGRMVLIDVLPCNCNLSFPILLFSMHKVGLLIYREKNVYLSIKNLK